MEEKRKAKIQHLLEHYPHKLILQCLVIFLDAKTNSAMEAKASQSIDRFRIRPNEDHVIFGLSSFQADALKKVLDAMVTLRKLEHGL